MARAAVRESVTLAGRAERARPGLAATSRATGGEGRPERCGRQLPRWRRSAPCPTSPPRPGRPAPGVRAGRGAGAGAAARACQPRRRPGRPGTRAPRRAVRCRHHRSPDAARPGHGRAGRGHRGSGVLPARLPAPFRRHAPVGRGRPVPDRVRRATAARCGASLALSSDYPCGEVDPLHPAPAGSLPARPRTSSSATATPSTKEPGSCRPGSPAPRSGRRAAEPHRDEQTWSLATWPLTARMPAGVATRVIFRTPAPRHGRSQAHPHRWRSSPAAPRTAGSVVIPAFLRIGSLLAAHGTPTESGRARPSAMITWMP
jgi:hypothetical protein